MHGRNDGFDGCRFWRRNAYLSVAIPDGREPVYKYIGSNLFYLYAVERFGWSDRLPGSDQFSRQRMRGFNILDGDGRRSSADRDYDPAGWF